MQRDKEKEHGWEIVKDRCTHRQRVRERGGEGGRVRERKKGAGETRRKKMSKE